MTLASQLRTIVPPKANLTDYNCPNQLGKVFIVTGSTSGIGKELVQILYSQDARVYMAGRSKEKADTAIADIRGKSPTSKGDIIFLQLDLEDLETVKKSAVEFISKEDKLDGLWNNAGVMIPPQGSKTKQGYELQLGTNNLAPFLFTKLLTPILVRTAKTEAKDSVRVVWVSSSIAEVGSPKGGVDMTNLDYKVDQSPWTKYGISKAGNYYHSTEFARRHNTNGIISVALNPGNLKTPLQRHMPSMQKMIFNLIFYPPIYGAYTQLYAGLSPDITMRESGCWIQPWGRIASIRPDLKAGACLEVEGGTGIAEQFWNWSESQVALYL